MNRRAFVAAAAGSVAPLFAGLPGDRGWRAASAQEATPAAGFDDGLAHPIPMTPAPGAGKDRTLVLSGGGIYMTAFEIGYLGELLRQGIDVANAEVVVGTSAGAIVGAVLTAGKLAAIAEEFDAIGEFPWLLAKMIPQTAKNPSQLRASEISSGTKVATPESIRAIGAAAMAADNPAGPEELPRTMAETIGFTDWPSPALYLTANDCYTGERLVISHEDGVPVNVAAAASSSVPGTFGPTWVNNRLCMDGSICQTDTHCDVVAGSKRALVISVDEGGASGVASGIANAQMWLPLQTEIDALEKGGTKTMVVVAGLEPGISKIDSNQDPKYILPQLAYGKQRAAEDADKVKAFWA